MKVHTLIEYLKDLPQDYDVDLSNILASDNIDCFEVILDSPIVGIAADDNASEVRFVLDKDKDKILERFGNIVCLK